MANNHFLSYVYRKNQYDLKDANGNPAINGVPHSFPSAQTVFRPAPSGITANDVTMVSLIEVLPTGLNQPIVTYYTADTVATLNTAAT